MLFLPEEERPRPGVVVIHDVRGLYEHYLDVGRRLARAGLASLAVDFYSRGEAPDTASLDAIRDFMRELPDGRFLSDVQAAVDWLSARPETRGRGIGVTGFCMGGKYALLAACRVRGLSAAAAWYGMLRAEQVDAANPEHALDAIRELRCPLLALFGEDDPIVPLDQVEELRRRVACAGADAEVVVYPGAGHAFANDTRPEAYRPAAAEDGWRRALAFFDKHLQGAAAAAPRSEP